MAKSKPFLQCNDYKSYDTHFLHHDNFRGKRKAAGSHEVYSGTTGKVTTYKCRDKYPKGTNSSIRRMARKASLD